MTTTRFTTVRVPFLAAVLVLALTVAACGDETAAAASPVAPTASAPTIAAPVASDDSLTAAITVALLDEYHAEAVYEAVLLDFGTVFPFANIVVAERRHAASIEQLFQARGLPVPVNTWQIGNVPRFESVTAACAAAAQAEIDNIAVYDRYLSEDLPLDVRNVFLNNRAASLNAHLPAFSRCR